MFLLMICLSFKSFAQDSYLQMSALLSANSPKDTATNSDSSDFDSFSKTYTFEQINWNDPHTNKLQGPQATATFYLPIPKQWKFTGVKLHLMITHSPLLKENSSLTLEVNNTPLSSLQLNKANAEAGVWNLELPPEAFTGDWISLNFVSSLRISADICEDGDNPSVWAYISPNSTLTINYNKIPFNTSLAQLPYPFIYTNSFEPQTSLLVLPPNPSVKELDPALRVMRALGEQLNYNHIDLSAITLEKITEQQKENNNLIFVGTTNQLTPLMSTAANKNHDMGALFNTADKGLNPNTGVISLVTSPWNRTNALLAITGDSNVAVEKAAKAFSNPQFTKLTGSKFALVNEEPQVVQQKKKQNKSEAPVSFKSLGFSDQTAIGLGPNTITYNFNLPNNKIPELLKIRTVLSHSLFSRADHSMLTVAVNGIKQASLFLSSSNEKNSSWTVKIPQNILNPGKNTLTYTFDLHLAQTGDCGPRYNYEAWGVIHAESSLQTFFSEDIPHIVLSRFPLALSTKTPIIVPEKLNDSQINTLIQFFIKLGALLGHGEPNFTVLGANEVNPALLQKHSNILIGTPQDNPWVAKAMVNASLKIDQGKVTLFDKDNKLSLTNKEPVGVVELMNSPWNNDNNTLLITGTNPDTVAWAMRILTEDKLRPQLTGNVATLNAQGTLSSFETRPDISWSFGQGFTKRNMQAFRSMLYQNLGLTIVCLFIIVVIFLAIIGFYKRRKKE